MTISFDSGRHEALIGSLTEATTAIGDVLDRLESDAGRLRSGWDGAARAAYDDAQARWTAAMSSMRSILAEAEGGAEVAGLALGAAEKAARAIWS
ncbi:WXG100 family type VII secretion target [Microbacterium sp. GXF7504]